MGAYNHGAVATAGDTAHETEMVIGLDVKCDRWLIKQIDLRPSEKRAAQAALHSLAA